MNSTKKALAIIIQEENKEIRPREFARLMWPDSEGWENITKAGPYGSTVGGGMNLAAGGFLGKLAKKGYLGRRTDRHNAPVYYLTRKGKDYYDNPE